MGIFDENNSNSNKCFGRWEKTDPTCTHCSFSAQCEAATCRRREQSYSSPSPQVNRVPSQNYSPQQSQTGTSQNYSSPIYPRVKTINRTTKIVLPTEGEEWTTRLLKNIAAGSLSATGYEIGGFFEEFKF
jgi:hypothetical protein